jgi:hypothetical protein
VQWPDFDWLNQPILAVVDGLLHIEAPASYVERLPDR